MDENLKRYLEEFEARLDRRFVEMDDRLGGRIERAAEATASEVGRLHTDIQQAELRLGAKLDELHTRLDRHAGLLQSGARQLTRIFRDSEALGKHWRGLARRVDAIEKRLEEGDRG